MGVSGLVSGLAFVVRPAGSAEAQPAHGPIPRSGSLLVQVIVTSSVAWDTNGSRLR
jgi:hypothetical protein